MAADAAATDGEGICGGWVACSVSCTTRLGTLATPNASTVLARE